MKDIKFFLKKKKKQSDSMTENDTKIYQKMKSKSWFNIDKNVLHNYYKNWYKKLFAVH